MMDFNQSINQSSPSFLVEHRPSTTLRHRTLFWASLASPVLLVPFCFITASVSCLQLLRGRPLFLFPCGVPCQCLACGAGRWLPKGVSNPAPLPPQNLLDHLFMTLSFPQVLISDLLWPSDIENAPQTGVEECLNLLLYCLCHLPCLAPVQQNGLDVGVEYAQLGSCADLFGCPDALEHDKGWSGLPDPGCYISVFSSLLVNHTSQIDE